MQEAKITPYTQSCLNPRTRSSKAFLDDCTYNVELEELYEAQSTCYYNQKMPYCPVLIKLTQITEKFYPDCNYLLQVWDQNHKKVYEEGLKSNVTVWCICFNYLIYKPQQPDLYSDSFVIVNLSKGGTKILVKNFTPDSSYKYLAYLNSVLYVANKEQIHMLTVVDEHNDLNEPLQYDFDSSKISVIKLGNPNIKMHGFYLNQLDSQSNQDIMLALETIDNQIDLNILMLTAPVGSKEFDYQLRQYRPIVSRSTNTQKVIKDSIKDFKMIFNEEGVQIGVALKESNRVDFYYDGMLCINNQTDDSLLVQETEMTFEDTYLLMQSNNKEVKVISHDLHSRQSLTQSQETMIESEKFKNIFHQRIKDQCKLFTSFVFLKTYIFVAHGNILSFFDISKRQFNNNDIQFQSEIFQVFRSKSTTDNEFVICVLLTNGDLEFLSPETVQDPYSNKTIEVYNVRYDQKENVGGKIIQFDQDRDENEWTFIVVSVDKNNYRLVCLHDQTLYYDLEDKFTDENGQPLDIDEDCNFVFIFSPKDNSEVLIHRNNMIYVYELMVGQDKKPIVLPLEKRKNTWVDMTSKQNKEVPFIEGNNLHSAVRVKENESLMILLDETYFYTINLKNLDETPSKFKQMCTGLFVSDHNFMYTLSRKNPETNTASGFRLYDIENCISQVNRRNKALKLQNSQAGSGDSADTDLQQDSSLQTNGVSDDSLINMKELMSYQLSSVHVGCQGTIDFSHQNQRLVYQSSFDQIDIVPVLHRNTIAFVGMDDRDQYLATKVLDDKFIALNRTNQLTTWSLLTGKVLEAHFNIQKEDMDYSNFEVYSYSENHLAYYQDWATKILLKSKTPLPNQDSIDARDFFDTKGEAPNIKNQTTFLEHKQKTYYEFRLIEIIDPWTVKEHCSFIFPFYYNDKFQHLLFNEQGNMMFERLKNARSFLYQMEKAPKPKQPTFVKWKQIRRFTQFPSDLVQCTPYPYIFSPDFSRYIDIDRKAKEFLLRDSRTQEIIWRIEDHVMNCKDEDYRVVAARMRWLDNNTLKYVNIEGIERKIDMTNKDGNEIQFNVIPLFDEFQAMRDKEKHFYLEKLQIEDIDSLTRLKLKYQAYKSAQLLDQKRSKESLYNSLFTVDYSIDNYRGKFVADLSFSYLHWNLMEKLESGQIQMDQIDINQFTKLIYNILPGGETVFHRLARNQKGPLIVQLAQKCHPNVDKLPIPPIEIHMPFLDSINESPQQDQQGELGENFIELLEQKGDYRTINQLLLYLAAYKIDHHSRSIVKSLPNCIEKELMNLTTYFNSRLIQTAQCKKYTKGKLNPAKNPQGVTVAKYCLSNELETILTEDAKVEENELTIQYFDVALVHQFDNPLCNLFYEKLGDTGDLSIFENKGIQMLIQYRWPLVSEYIQKRLFIPFLVFLISVSWFMSTSYMYRLESDSKYVFIYYSSIFVIMLESLYFLCIEIYQFSKSQQGEYFMSLWNYLDFIPPILLMIFCPLAIMGVFDLKLEDGTSVYLNLETTMQATINLLIWLKFLYFLRIFQGTGYLIKTIIAVVLDMRYFLLILLLTIIAFGDSFRAISTSNLPQNQFIESWWESFTYVYRMILGDFSTEVTVLAGGPVLSTSYSSAGNGFGALAPYYCWGLFYLCSVLNLIIMMNLLVAIISDSFNKLNSMRVQANYQEKCDIIAENTYMVPAARKTAASASNRYLLIATDKRQELGQQVRDVNFLVKDTHRKIADAQAQMEKRLVEQIEAIKLRNQRFIVQRLEKIGSENGDIIKMLRKEVRGKQGEDDEQD